jgi:hypothetical protein
MAIVYIHCQKLYVKFMQLFNNFPYNNFLVINIAKKLLSYTVAGFALEQPLHVVALPCSAL